MKTFADSLDMVKRCGIASMWKGWGGILPRQFIISLWTENSTAIDRSCERLLGSSNFFSVFLREAIVGAGGFLLAYPILTLSRRVSAAGQVVGMSQERFYGVFHCFWKVLRAEGPKGLFNGFGSFTVAVISIKISLWVLFMPTFTQWTWLKIGPNREEMIKEFTID
jgi:hypothetical protein